MTWIAAAAIVTATLASSPARADGLNEIRAVTYDEDAGTTRIHVRGAQTPTFTVYKLERPSRVVVDVPRARLAETFRGHEGATTLMPGTWAVSTIAAQQLDDGGQVVRVIVTLARAGRYDVKTDGNSVVVMVTARDAAPKHANPEALAKAQAESEQAKRAAAAAEQARDRAEKSSATAQAEAERLRKTAAEQTARAEQAQRSADEAKRAGQQANQAELARAKQEAAKARELANVAQAAADRMRLAAEQARSQALAEADRARKEADVAKQDVVKSRAEVERAKRQAEVAARALAE
ncbi:MAG: AMIN domain-containing protein, partial [Myxococcota bacterium]|nr:AMIN domain-containing protein [Myxococcota bacterium]